MGIRFHCPNGHKLNVKAFLAGKKGVCPDCGIKLRIPQQSEAGLGSGIDEAKLGPVNALLQPRPEMKAAAPTVSRPSAGAMTPAASVAPVRPATMAMPVMAASGYAPLAMPTAIPAAMPTTIPVPMPPPYSMPAAVVPRSMPMPPAPPSIAAPPAAGDPLADSLATWFVRPPSGGQFGPARGEVMRKWLTEGRVTSDSLVWREGWIDWLPATEVFPSLGKTAPALFAVQPTAGKPTAAANHTARKPAGGMGPALLVVLAIVCVLLVGVLAVVLSGAFSGT